MRITFLKRVARCLVVIMLLLGVAPRIEAGVVPSEMTPAATERTQDLGKIQQTIESKMVQERLAKLGFTSEEVKARLTRLSDQQLHQLALHLDDIKVAGDGLGVVIAILVIAILAVILIQLTGHRVIVK